MASAARLRREDARGHYCQTRECNDTEIAVSAGLCPGREMHLPTGEAEVTFAMSEPSADFREADVAEFGTAEPEVAGPERAVLVVRIGLGQETRTSGGRREELHDGLEVSRAAGFMRFR